MRPYTVDELWEALRERASAEGLVWLEERVGEAGGDTAALASAFPAVGRRVGRGVLEPGEDPESLHAWRLEDAGRAVLLAAPGERVAGELHELYRYGDAAERRGILRSLYLLPLGPSAVPLVEDAVRTNDTRLIAAALGPYAFRYLDDASLSQAVLKCVFLGVPISPLMESGLEERIGPEMSRMLAGYAHERVAAGRDVPPEVWPVIERFPPQRELEAMVAELDHPVEERRLAARRALAHSRLLGSRRSDANL